VSRTVKLALGIVISVAGVWWSMRGVDLGQVWAVLQRANYGGFALVVFATVLGFWIRAVRWRSLLGGGRPVGLDSLFSATMIGFMANNVLPLRLGEFVRAWALARRESLSKTTVFATVIVERIVDMLTLLGIFGIALLVHPIGHESPAWEITRRGAVALVVLSVGFTVFMVVLERHPRLMHSMVRRVSGLLPARHRNRAAVAIDHFVDGLSLFRDIPRLSWVFLLSFLMFGLIAFALWVGLRALGIRLPWDAGITMLVITAIGIMVPAAPGYIGTMNAACVAGLLLFGVGKDQSVPFSWFYWAGQWIPVTSLGLFYLRREGLSLRSLEEVQEGAA
jgi:uncharacterized protein (TIRG00374 family)